MNKTKFTLASLMASSLFGCAVEQGDEVAANDETMSSPFIADGGEPADLKQLSLHELSVGNETITFYGERLDDGSPSISLQASTSTYEQSVFDLLTKTHGELTALETFYALAPADSEPHEMLTESHEAQATNSGREDLTVQHVVFEPDSVAKLSSTLCDYWIFSDTEFTVSDVHNRGTWGYFNTAAMTTSWQFLCQENDCDVRRANSQVVGSCSYGTLEERVWRDTGSGWVAGSWVTRVGQATRYFYWRPSGDGQHVALEQKNATDDFYMKGNQLKFNCTSQLCPILGPDERYNY